MSDLKPVDPILVPAALAAGFVLGAVISCCCCRSKQKPEKKKEKVGGNEKDKASDEDASPVATKDSQDPCARYRLPCRFSHICNAGQKSYGTYDKDACKELLQDKDKDKGKEAARDKKQEKPEEKPKDKPKDKEKEETGECDPSMTVILPSYSCGTCLPSKYSSGGFSGSCCGSGFCGSSKYCRSTTTSCLGLGCKLPRVSNAFIRAPGW